MQSQSGTPGPVIFGPFTIRLDTGELLKNGRKIKLQNQSFQILSMLLESPGEVVTREKVREKLWPSDTFVDFDNSLNAAINKLRQALGDSAEQPHYVETLPRRGYRFIAVVGTPGKAVVPEHSPLRSDPEAVRDHRPWRTLRMGKPFFIVLLLSLAALLIARRNAGGLHRFSQRTEIVPIHSIAVLPLENFSGDSSQDYFADGMTDELITDLAKIHSLKVISRSSVMPYQGTREPLFKIAADLKVDAVVEGSIVRSGNRVRITAQLVDARSGQHLWAENYERELRDVLALQDEITRAIAQQVQVELSAQEQTRLASTKPVDPAAHDAYLKGRYYLETWSAEGSKKALEYLQQAIARDPKYAAAYGSLAEVYIYGVPGMRSQELMSKAKSAAQISLELDDTSGEAHAAMAIVKFYDEWDFPGSEKEFKRAIELSPNYAPVHHKYSHLLMAMGRFQESLTESNEYLGLDPLSPAANLHLGDHYLAAGQYDLAIAQELKTLKMDSNYIEAHRQLGQAYLGERRCAEAIHELETAKNLSGNGSAYLGWLGQAYGECGQRPEAEKLLTVLLKRSEHTELSPTSIAAVYAGLGERKKALHWLETARREHDEAMVDINVVYNFGDLRSAPRFQKLLREIGLPPTPPASNSN